MNDPLAVIQETNAIMRVAFHHAKSFPGVDVSDLEQDYRDASGEALSQYTYMKQMGEMSGMKIVGYKIPVMEFMEEIREKVQNMIQYLCILKYGEAFLDVDDK